MLKTDFDKAIQKCAKEALPFMLSKSLTDQQKSDALNKIVSKHGLKRQDFDCEIGTVPMFGEMRKRMIELKPERDRKQALKDIKLRELKKSAHEQYIIASLKKALEAQMPAFLKVVEENWKKQLKLFEIKYRSGAIKQGSLPYVM